MKKLKLLKIKHPTSLKQASFKLVKGTKYKNSNHYYPYLAACRVEKKVFNTIPFYHLPTTENKFKGLIYTPTDSVLVKSRSVSNKM